MDIKFEKDGAVKVTHKKFKEELERQGWKVSAPKKAPSKAPKKKKVEDNDDS